MNNGKYIKVGWVKEAHGLKGDVYIKLLSSPGNLKMPDWAESVKNYYLSKEDQLPKECSFISLKPHKEGMLAKIDGVSDRNQSEALRGFALYIEKEDLKSEPGESIYLHEILGFKVVDVKDNPLGVIKDFSTATAQDLIVIQTEDGLFDVPWVEEFISNLDFESKIVVMDLPEGLLSEI